MPDTAMRCIKDNKVSYVYGYELSLYDLQSYEVGRNDTTIFMTTQKYIPVEQHGLISLQMKTIRLRLYAKHQVLAISKKSSSVEHTKKR